MSASQSQSAPDHPPVADADLTKFQLRILATLTDERKYGLAIKRALESYYGEEVLHGRLYPNLDTLVERGYVDKSALDARTNEYAITEAGVQALCEDLQWVLTAMGVGFDTVDSLPFNPDIAVGDDA